VSASLTLVLASSSPRRSDLLARLGIPFVVAPAGVDETMSHGEAPAAHALRMAAEKAAAVAQRYREWPVLGADTIVVADATVLGKPHDDDDARSMLHRLAGRDHVVITAVALLFRERSVSHVERVRVTFTDPAPQLVDWYVATGEPSDKAGAYAVQGRGALFVERVEGNVQSVVGLPLAVLPALFGRVGLALRPDGARLTLVEERPVGPYFQDQAAT
jgi:septum formation protein